MTTITYSCQIAAGRDSRPDQPTPAQRQRLDPRWRNMLLTIHIAVAVGVLGTDIVLPTLAITGLASLTGQEAGRAENGDGCRINRRRSSA